MGTLVKLFENSKTTTNGDFSYKSTLNPLLDILFMCEYYTHNLDEVKIGNSEKEKLFSRFIRDPRFGIGMRDLGRELCFQSEVDADDLIKSGRFDDIFYRWEELDDEQFACVAFYMYDEVKKGNALAKKWMPRYSSKNRGLARRLAATYGMNKQQYGKFIKVDTTEQFLSRKETEKIVFEHVPSNAMLKYYNRFNRGEDTSERFSKYLEDVKNGKKEIKVSTTNVYDIFKNRGNIDADLFFEKLEKISGSFLPIVDVSGSMYNGTDSLGKALSIGHYLSKCSTFCNNQFVTFSNNPELVTLSGGSYCDEIINMCNSDWGYNTDLSAVMDLLKGLGNDYPDYIVILSDMEFDRGSNQSKDSLMDEFSRRGINTKIIWWNFNSYNRTTPETDAYGNIFMGGYNPVLLKYLQTGFDGEKLLDILLSEYEKIIS